MRDRKDGRSLGGFVRGSECRTDGRTEWGGSISLRFVKQIPDSDGDGSGKSSITRFFLSSSSLLPFQSNIGSCNARHSANPFNRNPAPMNEEMAEYPFSWLIIVQDISDVLNSSYNTVQSWYVFAATITVQLQHLL